MRISPINYFQDISFSAGNKKDNKKLRARKISKSQVNGDKFGMVIMPKIEAAAKSNWNGVDLAIPISTSAAPKKEEKLISVKTTIPTTVFYKGKTKVIPQNVEFLYKPSQKKPMIGTRRANTRLTEADRLAISRHINSNNSKYYGEILKLNQSKLKKEHIIQILDYIKSTNSGEVKFKMDYLKMLPDIMREKFGKILNNGGIGNAFFDSIGNGTYTTLLKSDLLTKNGPSIDFEIACNKIEKHIKLNKDSEQLDNADKKTRRKINTAVRSRQEKIASYLGEMLLAGSMVPSSTFEDLIYERQIPLEEISNSIDKLNKKDIDFIRKVSREAVIIDDYNYEEYPIPNSDIIKLINLLALNNDLKKYRYKGIDNINSKKYRETPDYIAPGFILNIAKIEHDLIPGVLMSNGIEKDVIKNYMKKYDMALEYSKSYDTIPSRRIFWDTNYLHLMEIPKSNPALANIVRTMTNRVANPQETRYNTKKIFLNYITNKNNPYGEMNDKTEDIFIHKGLNYEKWLNGCGEQESANFISSPNSPFEKKEKFTAKMWSRIPQESLFDGNCTSSPAAIGGPYGTSFPNYMLSSFINIIEVRNSKNEVIGMSRVFMADVEDKTSLIIDNIDVNNTVKDKYLYDKEPAAKYTEMIINCANKIAEEINTDPNRTIPVYLTTNKMQNSDFLSGLNQSNNLITNKVHILGNYQHNQMLINTIDNKNKKSDSSDPSKGLEFDFSFLIDVTKENTIKNSEQ